MMMCPLSASPGITKTICKVLLMDITEVEQVTELSDFEVFDDIDLSIKELIITEYEMITPCTTCDGVGA